MCMHLIKEFWNPLKVFDENLVDSQIEIIDIHVMVISNFHTPLSITDTINGHKISKDIWGLDNVVNLIDITDVYRTLHSTMTNVQGIFTKRDYVWVINLSIKLFKVLWPWHTMKPIKERHTKRSHKFCKLNNLNKLGQRKIKRKLEHFKWNEN